MTAHVISEPEKPIMAKRTKRCMRGEDAFYLLPLYADRAVPQHINS